MKTELTWTDAAWSNFKETLTTFTRLRAYYGNRIADEHEAEFYRTLQRVTFAAGPVNIQADGDGFLISFFGFVCGLVWTPDTDEQMITRINQAHNFSTNLEPDEIRDDWPRTGHWSAHS